MMIMGIIIEIYLKIVSLRVVCLEERGILLKITVKGQGEGQGEHVGLSTY